MDTQTITQIDQSAQRSEKKPCYERGLEHSADALLLLDRLRQAAREGVNPSTAELQGERRYGLRPVNRLVDLRKGRYNRHKYDIERIDCRHGVYRWRLHEPNRPGFPKEKRQAILSLRDEDTRSAKPEVPWGDRKPATGLPLFDAGVR